MKTLPIILLAAMLCSGCRTSSELGESLRPSITCDEVIATLQNGKSLAHLPFGNPTLRKFGSIIYPLADGFLDRQESRIIIQRNGIDEPVIFPAPPLVYELIEADQQ